MKLEKLNDNQIRCILDKDDLDQRELRLSELAYGSSKAKLLFRDMMEQASTELGFEVNNIPLMIEAIPISGDCLILVVTKVEDPEELDTRFSRFSRSIDMEEEEAFEDDEDEFNEETMNLDILDEEEFIDPDEEISFGGEDDCDEDSSDMSGTLDLMAPFAEAIAKAKEEYLKKKAKEKEAHNTSALQVISFSDLDTVITLCSYLAPFYHGVSHLYKDSSDNSFRLVLVLDPEDKESFSRACLICSEHGELIPSSYASLSYYEEHFAKMFQDNAIEVLQSLAS